MSVKHWGPGTRLCQCMRRNSWLFCWQLNSGVLTSRRESSLSARINAASCTWTINTCPLLGNKRPSPNCLGSDTRSATDQGRQTQQLMHCHVAHQTPPSQPFQFASLPGWTILWLATGETLKCSISSMT